MKKILFVCSGNTCRSPMAQALFNEHAKKNHIGAKASSAGLFAQGTIASQNSMAVMQERGLDLSMHKPVTITPQLAQEADLILTMTQSHRKMLLDYGVSPQKVFTLYEFAGRFGDVSDPYGGSMETYRQTADELEGLIIEILKKDDFHED